jgi:hypothetical protein
MFATVLLTSDKGGTTFPLTPSWGEPRFPLTPSWCVIVRDLKKSKRKEADAQLLFLHFWLLVYVWCRRLL